MKKILTFRVISIVVITIIGGCAASINPVLKNQIDSRLAGVAARHNITAPSEQFRQNLAVGQWVEFKILNEDGEPAIIIYKIVGKEGTNFMVEVVHTSYYGITRQKMLVDFSNLPKLRILKLTVKIDDDDPVVMEGPALVMTQSIYKKLIQSMVVQPNYGKTMDVSIPAGNFSRCYKINAKMSFGTITSFSSGYFHSSVPINGLVTAKSTKSKMELLDFGLSGASISF